MKKDINKGFSIKEFFDDDIGYISADITMMNPESLRAAHGYWVSCCNYSSSVLARIQQKIKELKRKREIRYKQTFLNNKNLRQSNDVARYNAELSSTINRLDNRINSLEQQDIKWSSLVNQCDYNRILCSRDQSFLESEMRTYFGRGGEGK